MEFGSEPQCNPYFEQNQTITVFKKLEFLLSAKVIYDKQNTFTSNEMCFHRQFTIKSEIKSIFHCLNGGVGKVSITFVNLIYI